MEAIAARLIDAEIVCIVADRATPIEEIARTKNIPFWSFQPSAGRFHPLVVESFRPFAPEWLGLTFNRLLADDVICSFGGRIFNLHMSLLPMFPGFGALRNALEARLRMTGVTIHLVDGETDAGPILCQAACPVGHQDDRQTLGRRMFEAALPALLQVVRSVSNGDLTYNDHLLRWPRAEKVERMSLAFPPVDEDITLFAQAYCEGLART
jgi:phosphoribosylglycinamide formyltransferase-1